MQVVFPRTHLRHPDIHGPVPVREERNQVAVRGDGGSLRDDIEVRDRPKSRVGDRVLPEVLRFTKRDAVPRATRASTVSSTSPTRQGRVPEFSAAVHSVSLPTGIEAGGWAFSTMSGGVGLGPAIQPFSLSNDVGRERLLSVRLAHAHAASKNRKPRFTAQLVKTWIRVDHLHPEAMLIEGLLQLCNGKTPLP